jgi:pimeloyl-ACP methyl ester carboxylesterase
MGWSMGVQVSLELAATAPELVAGTVLLNGTYGHVLSTGFQPVFSIPFLPKRIHAFLEWLQRHPNASERLAMLARVAELPTSALLALLGGGQTAAFRAMVRQYFGDVLGQSFQNYLRLFQELDAHSVYHLLPRIAAPALVISGALDPLTPAYQSREIARRMPNAEYISLLRASHFALMERPNDVVPAVLRFLQGRASW